MYVLQRYPISFTLNCLLFKKLTIEWSKVGQNPPNVVTLTAHISEAVQYQPQIFVLVWYRNTPSTCINYRRNLKGSSIFHVGLTWNDPYVIAWFAVHNFTRRSRVKLLTLRVQLIPKLHCKSCYRKLIVCSF